MPIRNCPWVMLCPLSTSLQPCFRFCSSLPFLFNLLWAPRWTLSPSLSPHSIPKAAAMDRLFAWVQWLVQAMDTWALHLSYKTRLAGFYICWNQKCKLEGSAMEKVKTCRERENERNRAWENDFTLTNIWLCFYIYTRNTDQVNQYKHDKLPN